MNLQDSQPIKVYCQHGAKVECNEKHVKKARKNYTCENCRQDIEKGETYYGLFSTLGQGKGKLFNMITGRICLICAIQEGFIEK